MTLIFWAKAGRAKSSVRVSPATHFPAARTVFRLTIVPPRRPKIRGRPCKPGCRRTHEVCPDFLTARLRLSLKLQFQRELYDASLRGANSRVNNPETGR